MYLFAHVTPNPLHDLMDAAFLVGFSTLGAFWVLFKNWRPRRR
jgi:hypothetical protein